ncbi:MAG: prolyl oligopeptidase family serine peptidase [Candidatus Spyradenecus sp.]
MHSRIVLAFGVLMVGAMAPLAMAMKPSAEAWAQSERVNEAWQKVYTSAVQPTWLAEGAGLWYRTKTRAGERCVLMRTVDGARWEAESPEALAEAAREAAPQLAEAMGAKAEEAPAKDTTFSPDDAWQLYVRDGNLWAWPQQGQPGGGVQLTTDGNAQVGYELDSARWSPDGQWVAAYRLRRASQPTISLVSSVPEGSLKASVRQVSYPRAGDEVDYRRPVLIDFAKRAVVPVRGFEALGEQYLCHELAWRPDSQAFTFEFVPRGFGGYVIAEVDTQGRITRRVEERTATFFPYTLRSRLDTPDGLTTYWVSERDGWRHIWRFRADGAAPEQLTRGEWVVHRLLALLPEGALLFTAGGRVAGEDPYQQHLMRLEPNGSVRDLTPENAHHQVFFAPDQASFVDNASRVDAPNVATLRRVADGSIIEQLQQEDITDLLATGWVMPKPFCAKGRDGQTDIWGTIRFPPNFDPKGSYPVLEQIYAGPHDAHVPKQFLPVDYFSDIFTALGFIVVRIDGMGTAWRSKAFHDVCWKNLRDAGFPDRIAWMKAAAAAYPAIDLTRVGIFGWSAGGQNAMAALLWHHDFYKAAIALCGCHDNRIDKLWWNEQWMGYPVGPHYAANSNVENAHLLQGHLFLINGELDDNVDPTSTLKVVHALIQANKDFEQLYLPMTNHFINGPYIERRMKAFFLRALE